VLLEGPPAGAVGNRRLSLFQAVVGPPRAAGGVGLVTGLLGVLLLVGLVISGLLREVGSRVRWREGGDIA